MKFFTLISLTFSLILQGAPVWSSETPPADSKNTVKYKSGSEINFEKLLIQGELKRPELGVVTGNNNKTPLGLIRVRKNFHDKSAAALGEVIK